MANQLTPEEITEGLRMCEAMPAPECCECDHDDAGTLCRACEQRRLLSLAVRALRALQAADERVADLEAEVERLRAALPMTRDGKIVLWGDYVWSRQLHKWYVYRIGPLGSIEVDNEQGSRFWRPARDHFSTLEAAKAAKEE